MRCDETGLHEMREVDVESMRWYIRATHLQKGQHTYTHRDRQTEGKRERENAHYITTSTNNNKHTDNPRKRERLGEREGERGREIERERETVKHISQRVQSSTTSLKLSDGTLSSSLPKTDTVDET